MGMRWLSFIVSCTHSSGWVKRRGICKPVINPVTGLTVDTSPSILVCPPLSLSLFLGQLTIVTSIQMTHKRRLDTGVEPESSSYYLQINGKEWPHSDEGSQGTARSWKKWVRWTCNRWRKNTLTKYSKTGETLRHRCSTLRGHRCNNTSSGRKTRHRNKSINIRPKTQHRKHWETAINTKLPA